MTGVRTCALPIFVASLLKSIGPERDPDVIRDQVREAVAYYEAQLSIARAEIVHLKEENRLLRTGEADRRLKDAMIVLDRRLK